MKKIIISVVSIVLVLIVGLTALILSLIPSGLNSTIAKPDEVIIVCSKTKDLSPTALIFRGRDAEEKDYVANIYSLFCHAFEQNTLKALFEGELNKDVTSNYLDKGSKSISSNANSDDKITICFKFNTSQKINEYEYNYLFFEISNTDKRGEVEFGVKSSLTISDSTYYYNYYYTGKANFAKLYNYILEII